MGISSTSSMLDQLTVKDNLDICGQCSGRASSFVQQSLTFFPGHGGVLIGEDEANGYHICQHPAEAGGGGGKIGERPGENVGLPTAVTTNDNIMGGTASGQI